MNANRRWIPTLQQWLRPGLNVKRWLVVVIIANTLIAVGAAMFLLEIYRTTPEVWWLPVLSYASLRFLARPLRVLIFGGLGFGLLGWGIWNLNRSLMEPFVPKDKPVIEQLARFRQLERGPKLVAIGGGTGQATLLRGLKAFTSNLFAIVSVADDGGSSGRLRRSLGILPPGDIRNCLAALSNDEDLVSQLFQYRFAQDGDLLGHSFGNLYLTALTEITGSFEEAITTSGKILGVQGRVLPATLADVTLEADVAFSHELAEVRVSGESAIPTASGNIQRVWLDPQAPSANPRSVQALLTADMIVVGPGSLYTSILPNLLVPDIAGALRSTRALRVFVVNVATQPGETDGYTAGDHLRAVEDHLGDLPFEIVLCNKNLDLPLPETVEWVRSEQNLEAVYPVHFADVVDENRPWRHDSIKLARVLIDLLEERTGPMVI
ncbi:MAG TPA: gluconeogenesis factor YvcK family protein [Anaerolineales bacterium]|nr:gluconeogenesis factor YvcK family protein [Anaerolineales bacterium]